MEFFKGCIGTQVKIDGHTLVQVNGTCLFCSRSHSVFIKHSIYFEIKYGQNKQGFQLLPEESREFLHSGRCASCLAIEKQKSKPLITDGHILEPNTPLRHEIDSWEEFWESVEEERKSEAIKPQEIVDHKSTSIRLTSTGSFAHRKNEHEEREFFQLVAEISPLGFTTTKEVSAYIVNNNLGLKYKHISGVVTMEGEGREWDYRGGFPARIYARLCDKLGLSNQRSQAKLKNFIPFKDIIDN
jgi:hypothetical protein